MDRDVSGTGWQPDSTSTDGLMTMKDDSAYMLYGYLTKVYDHQGGTRGVVENFAENMFMARASRPPGNGRFGVCAMLLPGSFSSHPDS
jgi:hypothetical protein